jgi:phage host-nuclease inhibitor protein Gam
LLERKGEKMLDGFTITDMTTREELIARVNDLDEEVSRLETEVEDNRQEIADLTPAHEQQDRLAEAADLMADLGRIHPTPQAKADWIAGR